MIDEDDREDADVVAARIRTYREVGETWARQVDAEAFQALAASDPLRRRVLAELDHAADVARWESFVDDLRDVLGWPAIVRQRPDLASAEVCIDTFRHLIPDEQLVRYFGTNVVDDTLEGAARRVAGPTIAAITVGMDVRAAWWGTVVP